MDREQDAKHSRRGPVQIGYAYILSNSAMPGLLKIGSTSLHPRELAMELSRSPAAPSPFELGWHTWTFDPSEVEEVACEALSSRRISPSQTFFRISLTECVRLMEGVVAKAIESRLKEQSEAVAFLVALSLASSWVRVADERVVATLKEAISQQPDNIKSALSASLLEWWLQAPVRFGLVAESTLIRACLAQSVSVQRKVLDTLFERIYGVGSPPVSRTRLADLESGTL